MLSDRCPVLSVLSVTMVYCDQTVGWIKTKLGMQVGLGPGHIVSDGDPAPPPPKGQSPPIFGPHLLWPNGCMDQDATWYGGRPRPRQLCVRWGPGSPLPRKGAEPPPPPKFSAHLYCGQTTGWIKMAFGTEVGLSPGDFVLNGDPAPPQKGDGTPSQIFGPILLWPNGLMHQDATWYGGRPQPRRLCVRRGPSPTPQKGGRALQFSAHVYCGLMAAWIKMPLGTEVGIGLHNTVLDGNPAPPPLKGHSSPNFRPMSVVAKRLDRLRCHLVWR